VARVDRQAGVAHTTATAILFPYGPRPEHPRRI
jgi:hypothetical protein